METDNPLPNNTDAPEEEITWPQTPSAIFILGKRQGTQKEHKQLKGRVAMAAALWHSAPSPKPYLMFVARDVHGAQHAPDTDLVKQMLVDLFEIPIDFLVLRRQANCTLLEVRAARVLSRTYQLSQIFVLTHLYHAPRAQRYFNEILSHADVIPVHPDILEEITFPPHYVDLRPELEDIIQNSMPVKFDAIREYVIEWLLGLAHTIDSRGRFERWLARVLRPTAYR